MSLQAFLDCNKRRDFLREVQNSAFFNKLISLKKFFSTPLNFPKHNRHCTFKLKSYDMNQNSSNVTLVKEEDLGVN